MDSVSRLHLSILIFYLYIWSIWDIFTINWWFI